MNNIKLFCLLISFFLTITIFPQTKIDSLKHELSVSTTDFRKTELVINIARSFITSNKDSSNKYFKTASLLLEKNPDTYLEAYYYKSLGHFSTQIFDNDLAIIYLKKSFKLYSLIDSTYDMAIVNTLMGNSFENKMIYDSSLYYYELSNNTLDSNKHISLIAANLNNMANTYKSFNDLDKATKCYFDALIIFKKLGQKENAAIALMNIAILNLDEDMHLKAVEYIKQSIALNKEIDNKYELCSNYNILGNANRELNNYDTAISVLNEAINIAEFLNYTFLKAQSYHNMGSVYLEIDEYDQAIKYFRKSLIIATEAEIPEGEILNMINIGRVYTKRGSYSLANDFLFKALELCEQLEYTDYHEALYFAITTNFEKWQKYNKSLEYYQLYSNIKDSMLNVERHRELQSIQIQYDTEQKELENQQLKNKNKLQEYVIFSKSYSILVL